MHTQLTRLQAYNAAFRLFEIRFKDMQSKDSTMIYNISSIIIHMISNISILKYWVDITDIIVAREGSRTARHITSWQAFIATVVLLNKFYTNKGDDPDVDSYIAQLQAVIDHKDFNNVLWQKWLQCVEQVVKIQEFNYVIQFDEGIVTRR